MKRLVTLLLCLMACLNAQDASETMMTEQVEFKYPAGENEKWEVAHEQPTDRGGKFQIFVPKGQSLDKAIERIVVVSSPSNDDTPSSINEIISELGKQMPQDQWTIVEQDRDSVIIKIVDDQGDTNLVRYIITPEGIHIIGYASSKALTPDQLGKWTDTLKNTKVHKSN